MASSDLDHRLNDTVGCVFIGILFELILYGFSLAQTQYYFHEYPCDPLYTRAMVAFLWSLDTVRTCCDLQFLWAYLVTSHGNLDGMGRFTNTFIVGVIYCTVVIANARFKAEFFFASFTVLIAQLFYIYSIWRFLAQKSWHRVILTVTIAVLALLSFCGGVVSVHDFTINPALASSLTRAEIPASIQTVTAVVTDVYIAIALLVILRGKRTGFLRTDSLITKLVAFVIHRGIVTALMQLLHFATYIGTYRAGPNKLIWALFHFPGSKVYTNSLLAVLNIRRWLRDSPTEAMVEEIELAAHGIGGLRSSGPQIPTAQILVTREVCSDAASPGWARGKSGAGL